MGNTISTRGQQFIDQFSANYTFEKIVDDPRLGEVELFKKISDPLEYVAVKHYNDQQQQGCSENAFQNFLSSNGNFIESSRGDHQNVVRVYAYEGVEERNNSSQSGQVRIYYEHCATSIREQIKLRQPSRLHFSPEELWRTTLSVILAGQFLLDSGRFIGDVQPSKILISKSGIVKVVPYMQCPEDVDGVSRILVKQQPAFLSPECLPKLTNHINLTSTTIDHAQNDMFGLGMSILEMATLADSKQLYVFKDGSMSIDQSKLDERLAKAARYYGDYLEELLRRMLDMSQITRATFTQLTEELEQYSDSIISGQGFYDFDILNPPRLLDASTISSSPEKILTTSRSASANKISVFSAGKQGGGGGRYPLTMMGGQADSHLLKKEKLNGDDSFALNRSNISEFNLKTQLAASYAPMKAVTLSQSPRYNTLTQSTTNLSTARVYNNDNIVRTTGQIISTKGGNIILPQQVQMILQQYTPIKQVFSQQQQVISTPFSFLL